MIDFMIIGLPRSGTTWASNWLTTDAIHCVHDPLYTEHYSDWDERLPALAPAGAVVGVSCTGIWRWAGWVNAHPARKIILHRDPDEIRKSMAEIGMPGHIGDAELKALDSVIGLHVPHSDLFDTEHAEEIWKHLAPGQRFNPHRHKALVQVEMQPKFSGLSVGPGVMRKLISELERI